VLRSLNPTSSGENGLTKAQCEINSRRIGLSRGDSCASPLRTGVGAIEYYPIHKMMRKDNIVAVMGLSSLYLSVAILLIADRRNSGKKLRQMT
jgi:hypothetical protein